MTTIQSPFDMDKTKLNQIRLDSTRLENAAERLLDLRDAYMNTKDDLRIAQQGLRVIATWASFPEIDTDRAFKVIYDRARDALALISEENR